jgi:DNA-directed RNA polymerase subunit H (RpoH/RPB5)
MNKKRFMCNNSEITHFRKFIEDILNNNNCDEIQIIFNKSLIPKTLVWAKINPEYHRFIFSIDELNYSVCDNVMVPPHKIVNSVDHPEFEKYPRILTYDPMVRYLGAKIGDVIEIQRSDGLYYRVVAPDI